jgi:hypothetical protein
MEMTLHSSPDANVMCRRPASTPHHKRVDALIEKRLLDAFSARRGIIARSAWSPEVPVPEVNRVLKPSFAARRTVCAHHRKRNDRRPYRYLRHKLERRARK